MLVRSDSRKILVVLHQETSSAGKLGQMLRAKGNELDVRKPRFGDQLPETMAGHAGAVIFGGPMSANDCQELDFIRKEIDWLSLPLREEVPYLGICLGGQLLARQLGARVAPHPEGRAEIGYYRIRPTAAGLDLVPHWPDHVYHWHREGFELPRGAELLAEGDEFPNQAFRYGDSAFAIQFHPEVTLAMLHRWTVRASHRFNLPGAQGRAEHLEGRLIHDWAIKRWLDSFLGRWLRSGRRRGGREAA
jgi:GMP synthase (glutamine-hydrolysing)